MLSHYRETGEEGGANKKKKNQFSVLAGMG